MEILCLLKQDFVLNLIVEQRVGYWVSVMVLRDRLGQYLVGLNVNRIVMVLGI
jgi:hypothetical protein